MDNHKEKGVDMKSQFDYDWLNMSRLVKNPWRASKNDPTRT